MVVKGVVKVCFLLSVVHVEGNKRGLDGLLSMGVRVDIFLNEAAELVLGHVGGDGAKGVAGVASHAVKRGVGVSDLLGHLLDTAEDHVEHALSLSSLGERKSAGSERFHYLIL